MSATSPQLNLVNAIQAAPPAARPQDAATPDVPFSQVLSSEMAQQRRSSEARDDAEATPAADAAGQAAGTAAGPTDPGTTAVPAKAAAATDASGEAKNPAAEEGAAPLPEALLTFAMSPDLLKQASAPADPAVRGTDLSAAVAPAGTPHLATRPDAMAAGVAQRVQAALGPHDAAAPVRASVQPAQPAGTSTDASPAAMRADRAAEAAQTAQATQAARAEPAPTARPDPQNAAATAFAGQMAAARQSEAMKHSERQPDFVTGATAHAATPHALLDQASSLSSLASNTLAPSVGSTAWSQALGEKIVWMASGAQQTASLTLNPPNMGPLQIVLNVSNDQATASFFSAQPEVRQALEAAFPRLRDMMSEAGIQLGQATVSADTPRQQDTPDRQAQRVPQAFIGRDDGQAVLQANAAPLRSSGRGLVDTFA